MSQADLAQDLRILVVDDLPAVRSLLVELFSARGFPVQAVEDPAEARDAIEDRVPTLVCSGLDFPDENGQAFAGWLREHHPSLPLIFVRSRGNGHCMPGYDVFEYPIADPGSLLGRAESLMRAHQTRQMSVGLADVQTRLGGLEETIRVGFDDLKQVATESRQQANAAQAKAEAAVTAAAQLDLLTLTRRWFNAKDPILWGVIVTLTGGLMAAWSYLRQDLNQGLHAVRELPAMDQRVGRIEKTVDNIQQEQRSTRESLQLLLQHTLRRAGLRSTGPGVGTTSPVGREPLLVREPKPLSSPDAAWAPPPAGDPTP